MRTDTARTIRLKDYKKPDYTIKKTDLTIQIFENYTQVESTLHMHINPEVVGFPVLQLNGIDQQIQQIQLDDLVLTESDYQYEDELLTVQPGKDEFVFKSITHIKPNENTSLEGLYQSGTMICSQCEAEGFRKITFYLDRPDVMSVFTTRIEADAKQYPILLSNGNPVEQGELAGGRHFATWHDPFPKPSYLFAAVAGDLVRHDDVFVTQSGREVSLRIFAEAHNAHKTDFALDSLKRSMAWDEKRYGREYDLDIFMIVASDFFNMGAMENKGLNIFNSAAVLASPETSSDDRFDRIEAIVAHEYFHNWSGNRVTCRDWFQLTLKEGLTVYRDSQFTADTHNATVKRISDVDMLKAAQFSEDAGPNAHPIQPQEYVEINNFYTATVYEKGAEVIGMIHTILGEALFRQGTDLYFETFDGQAATTDDFIGCMEKVSGHDFTQFKRWYVQAGTPNVAVEESFDANAGQYKLTFTQSCRPTPNQPEKRPFVIPVKMALLSEQGEELPISCDGDFNSDTSVLLLKEATTVVTFSGLKTKPVASLFRDFSAPVTVDMALSDQDQMTLATKDSNAFNRTNALQSVFVEVIRQLNADIDSAIPESVDELIKATLGDDSLVDAVKAQMITLPSFAVLRTMFSPINAQALAFAREKLKRHIAVTFAEQWQQLANSLASAQPYEFNAAEAGRRALHGTAISYWVSSGQVEAINYAEALYRAADNQSDRLNGLQAVLSSDDQERSEKLLTHYYRQWKDDTQMVETWLALNAGQKSFDVAQANALMAHEAFDLTNPNKVRSVLGAFASNFEAFHAGEVGNYQFIAEQIVKLDQVNPQVAARFTKVLESWRVFTEDRGVPMKQALELIVSTDGLSPDVSELAMNALK
ncbi:aminopeptidase N [Reinekea forsetii]|nr:aminopeptidase N [Reinekea forsetii]